MRWIRGFDRQILEALTSDNNEIRYEAVCAAGGWQINAAWPHISALVKSKETEKYLLLAAIEAVAGIRPEEAGMVLNHLLDSHDGDVVDAVNETLAMTGGLFDDAFDEGDDDEFLY